MSLTNELLVYTTELWNHLVRSVELGSVCEHVCVISELGRLRQKEGLLRVPGSLGQIMRSSLQGTEIKTETERQS